jgi:hypothetical protein
MLDIKARPGYMGNPQGEGAIWQRTPSGVDVKVGTETLYVSLDFLIVCCAAQRLLCLYRCHSNLLSLLALLFLILLTLLSIFLELILQLLSNHYHHNNYPYSGFCNIQVMHSRHVEVQHLGSVWYGGRNGRREARVE